MSLRFQTLLLFYSRKLKAVSVPCTWQKQAASEPEEPQPLNTAHFLIGRRIASLPPKSFHATICTPSSSREELTQRWNIASVSWTTSGIGGKGSTYWSWDLHTHTSKNSHSTPLKEADLVLIGEERAPRQIWKTGIIKEVFPGRDGLVRACAVPTSDGKILWRPVQLLYPLEL